jgi:type II secretory pathway pseudopilin PulG
MKAKGQGSRVEGQTQAIALRSHSGPRPSTLDPRPARRALTLIELLVVIIILTTVVAAAIPVLSPADDARRIREASRAVNTFITGAQSRAIMLNRPVGIAIKRLSSDSNTSPNKLTDPFADVHRDNGVCLELYYVEQQPPYCGFDANSRACVALHPDLTENVLIRFVTRGTNRPTTTDRLPPGWDVDMFPTGTIRPGDVVEVGGTRYELLPETSDPGNYTDIEIDSLGYFKPLNSTRVPTILAQPINDSGQQVNVRYDDWGLELMTLSGGANRPFWTDAGAYRVLRQPTPTSDEPYQLPEGTAIDLRASGVGIGDYFYWPDENDNSQGVIIMFTPEGRVSRVTYSQLPITDDIDGTEPGAFDQPVTENIYLLIGKRENIPATEPTTDGTLVKTLYSTASTEEKRTELKEKINWLLGTSQWIVIGSQSGRVATVQNAIIDPVAVIDDPNPDFAATEGTEEMRARQIVAAREFTRDTRQQGGR